MPFPPAGTILYWNEATRQFAGPFPVNSLGQSVYANAGIGWIEAPDYAKAIWDGMTKGDTGKLIPGDDEIPPVNFPPDPLPVPMPGPGGGGKIYTPSDAPAGSVYIVERFGWINTVANRGIDHKEEYFALVGSDEWRVLDSDNNKYVPQNRAVLTPQTLWTTKSNNPRSFVLVGGFPQAVPAAGFRNGHYDCRHLGDYLADNQPQDQFDAYHPMDASGDCNPQLVPPPPPDKNCGFYDCPSNNGTGPCCHDYTSVFTSIRDAIQHIADKMGKVTTDACDISDKCLDQITDKIWKKLNDAKRQCKKCCDYIQNGVAMSSEDAFTCSNLDCNCAEKHCGPVSEGGDGTECNVGVWHAYCNPITGNYFATQDDSVITGDDVLVGEYDTKDEALSHAKANCEYEHPGPEKPPPKEPSPLPSGHVSEVCDINLFATAAGRVSIMEPQIPAATGAFAVTTLQAIIEGAQVGTSDKAGIGALTATLKGIALAKPVMAAKMAPIISILMGCQDQSSVNAAAAIGAAAVVEEFTGIKMSEFCPHLAYNLHAGCRNLQMSPGESIQAFLHSDLPQHQIDTHFAIAGYCPNVDNYHLDVLRKKLSPLDLATLRHREKLTPSEYNTRIRQLGYIKPTDADEIYELTNQIPPPSDLIRMMVRDADDPNIAATFGTDSQFAEKYNTQLKKWAKDQGMSDLAMQYLWRSHWSIPSPGQLFTINHRLRHDPQYNADGKLFDKIKAALVQQDILPFWIPYLTATSFKPMTRVDTRRAFNIGALDEPAVLKSYYDQGYSDDNAAALLKFTVKLRDQSAASHKAIKLWVKGAISRAEAEADMLADGLPNPTVQKALKTGSHGFATSWPVKAFINGDMPANDANQKLRDFGVEADVIAAIMASAAPSVRRHPILVRYASGNTDRATALGAMTVYGMDPGRSNRMLDKVEFQFNAQQSIACQHAIKQRFLLGELDDAGTNKVLIANGIVKERADLLLDHWRCEKSAIGRSVPGQTLCEWLGKGVLNPGDFIKRLTNIGYTKDDASQMFVDCQGNINQKQAAEALKQAKATAASIEKSENKAKKAAAQIEKELAQLARHRKTAQDARKRRSSAVIKAGEKLYPKVDADLNSVLEKVNKTNEMLQSTFGLTADEAVESVLRAAETFRDGTLDDYPDIASKFAQAMVDKVLEPDEIHVEDN